MINKTKNTNYLIISIGAEKAAHRIQHPFIMKTLKTMHNKESTQPNNRLHDKSSVNILHNGEKIKAFPLSSGTSQGCPLSPLVFNTVLLEVLVRVIRQETEIKGI